MYYVNGDEWMQRNGSEVAEMAQTRLGCRRFLNTMLPVNENIKRKVDCSPSRMKRPVAVKMYRKTVRLF